MTAAPSAAPSVARAGAGGRRAGPLPAVPAPVTERLGFRLSWLFAVALLPLGLISLAQATAWLGASREQATAALVGETLEAAAREARLIHAAQGTALGLALTVRPLLLDERACDAAMDAILAEVPAYSLAVFIPADGRMRCASGGRSFDFAGNPNFEDYLRDPRPLITVNPRGPVSGTSVVTVSRPVRDEAGAYLGAVSLSLPHAALDASPAADESADAPALVTFAPNGSVLTASVGLDQAGDLLPQGVDVTAFAGPAPASFAAVAATGEERLYAVAELLPGEVYALGSIPARQAVSLGGVPIFAPFGVAALMWAGSLLVAWFAAERLVTRYIRRLSRAIGAFAGGSRIVGDLDMNRAPAEIREVGGAFLRMVDTVLHDEAELEDTVHHKEVLLREVHHRVKNNLQLIASIMNLQMRRARSPETRALMLGLQERVMSLATVHKELYQTSGLTDVRADELLGDITRQIVAMASGPGRRFLVDTDFAPLRLTPDQAVPLSLLLTEGLTNALKYAVAPGGGAPRLSVSLTAPAPGRAELLIRNSHGGAPPEDAEGPASEGPASEGTGLGGQLIAAFASQLGGEVRQEPAGGDYVLGVAFPLLPLDDAEERRAPA